MRPWVRLTFGQTLGQVDLWSDVPNRDIPWPHMIILHQVGIWSDVPPGRAIMWPSVKLLGSGWHLVRSLDQVDIWSEIPPGRDIMWPSGILLWVRLIFGQIFWSGWYLVRCNPRQRYLVAKCETTLGQGWHFGQIFGSDWHLFRHTPQAETLCGQVWYYFQSGWHLARSLDQVNIWSDGPHIIGMHTL